MPVSVSLAARTEAWTDAPKKFLPENLGMRAG